MNVKNVIETPKAPHVVSKSKFYIDIGQQCQKATRKQGSAASSRRRKSLDAWHDWKWQPLCVGQESYVEELTPEGSGTSSLCRSGAQVLAPRREWRILITRLVRWIYQRTPYKHIDALFRVRDTNTLLLANYYCRRMIKEVISFRRVTYSYWAVNNGCYQPRPFINMS